MKYWRTGRPCKPSDEYFIKIKLDTFVTYDKLSDSEKIKKDEGIENLKEKLYTDKRYLDCVIEKFRSEGIEISSDEAEDLIIEYLKKRR